MGEGITSQLGLRPRQDGVLDGLALGEVMLRLDPGEERITQTRTFRVWEGGGEYNVMRALRRVFGFRTGLVTALVDNPVGRLLEDIMLQGGVDLTNVVWREYDGLGVQSRNGLYFMERGFGIRSGLASMDRGHTAVSQMKVGDIDWDGIFSKGVRWFHTGGIYCGLSATTPAVAKEAMESARRNGVVVSYDCNYRPSLWKAVGGRARAAEVNRELAPYVDVLFGHEGDLALELGESSFAPPTHTMESYEAMAKRVIQAHPNFKVIATPTRKVRTASKNDYGAFAYANGKCYQAAQLLDLDILDRVGGGDAFASAFIAGIMEDRSIDWSLNAGVAHAALAMSTPGDNSYATRAEIERIMSGGSANAQR